MNSITLETSAVPGRGGAIRVRDYRPTEETGETPFLWIHGGGFSSGGIDAGESDAPARAIAATGRWVRTVDYRLAPSWSPLRDAKEDGSPNRHPAALHDVIDSAADLSRTAGRRIAIGGASAGANLAAAATLAIRDAHGPMPESLVLAYGIFHASLPENLEVEGSLRGPIGRIAFTPKMTRRMNLNYVGSAELMVPGTAFPGGADLSGFPPSLLLNATNDRLRRSGHAFAEELDAAGNEVSEIVIPALHGFLNTAKRKPFVDAIDALIAWLTAHQH